MSKKFISHAENSKANWGEHFNQEGDVEFVGWDVLSFGCLQRIATATEAMAKNYVEMQQRLDYLQKRLKQAGDSLELKQHSLEKLERSNRALRGHVKRLKKLKP